MHRRGPTPDAMLIAMRYALPVTVSREPWCAAAAAERHCGRNHRDSSRGCELVGCTRRYRATAAAAGRHCFRNHHDSSRGCELAGCARRYRAAAAAAERHCGRNHPDSSRECELVGGTGPRTPPPPSPLLYSSSALQRASSISPTAVRALRQLGWWAAAGLFSSLLLGAGGAHAPRLSLGVASGRNRVLSRGGTRGGGRGGYF